MAEYMEFYMEHSPRLWAGRVTPEMVAVAECISGAGLALYAFDDLNSGIGAQSLLEWATDSFDFDHSWVVAELDREFAAAASATPNGPKGEEDKKHNRNQDRPPSPEPPDGTPTHLSASDFAKLVINLAKGLDVDVPTEKAVTVRLHRLKAGNLDCVRSVDSPRKNEPRGCIRFETVGRWLCSI